LKGDGIACFVILKDGVIPSEALTTKLKDSVRTAIGPIATPDVIIYSDLPKVLEFQYIIKNSIVQE
jgi:acetyl-CoA synthetase